jgi:dephospho-CoA kinase
MAFKYAVALTGGIATGKSTVGKILQEMGFDLIDADKIAHALLEDHSSRIVSLFGREVMGRDGRINREALGRIVFANSQKKRLLESLLHPLIYQRIEDLSMALDREERSYLVDIPLFFETRRYPIERVVVVYAPREIQQTRLMMRNGYTQEEAERRLSSQMDIEEKRKMATYIIDNSSTVESLQEECVKISKLIG